VGDDEHVWISARSQAQLEDFVQFFSGFGFFGVGDGSVGRKIPKKWREKVRSG
jgi:hypothetical protein